jgi:hypothetical protein
MAGVENICFFPKEIIYFLAKLTRIRKGQKAAAKGAKIP